MHRLQRTAGAAALVQALAYVAGFAALLSFLDPGDASNWSAVRKLEFVLDRKLAFQALNIFIYVVFAAALVVLTTGLHERIKHHAPALSQIAAAFGLIWAGLLVASGMVASTGLEAVAAIHATSPQEAAEAWIAIVAIQDGLGGGVEVVGGLWMLLGSAAALRTRSLPKPLNHIGLLVGCAGILTVIPPLAGLGAIFGLGQIVWFAWVGIVLLREPPNNASFKPMSPHGIG